MNELIGFLYMNVDLFMYKTNLAYLVDILFTHLAYLISIFFVFLLIIQNVGFRCVY